MGAAAILEFTNMLMTSVWIELLGCNLNCVYLDTPEIGKFHQKCKILKIQDRGRRHLGFY
jgi:organic radical activating enzyme